MPKAGDWTVERWRTEPRLVGLEFVEPLPDETPALWKELTVASVLAIALWVAAAVVFG